MIPFITQRIWYGKLFNSLFWCFKCVFHGVVASLIWQQCLLLFQNFIKQKRFADPISNPNTCAMAGRVFPQSWKFANLTFQFCFEWFRTNPVEDPKVVSVEIESTLLRTSAHADLFFTFGGHVNLRGRLMIVVWYITCFTTRLAKVAALAA